MNDIWREVVVGDVATHADVMCCGGVGVDRKACVADIIDTTRERDNLPGMVLLRMFAIVLPTATVRD